MALTLADGQLAASSTAIVSGTGSCVDISLCNTSASLTETVVLTVTRNSGTARRIARLVLAPNEQATVTGIPLESADTLYGTTSDATTVDYVVVRSNQSFGVNALDANGAIKQVNSGVVGAQTLTGTMTANAIVSTTTATIAGLINSAYVTLTPGASTAAAGSTTADAGVLPAATSVIYPTTAADDTTGVRIHADDKVTGRTLLIGNGVSNKILKVYAPSGGTINGAAGDAAFSSASGKGVIITCLSSASNTWLAW